MLTVMNTPQAPEDYSYHVDVPGGGHITLNTDGTASVLDANFQKNRDTPELSLVDLPPCTDRSLGNLVLAPVAGW